MGYKELAQAIREGCKVAPTQLKHRLVNKKGCACAMGAMGLGFGIPLDKLYRRRISPQELFAFAGVDADKIITNPANHKVNKTWLVIEQLNDHAKWTREAIADWLETLESKNPQ